MEWKLARKDWSGLEDCNSVDDMVDIFTKNIDEALDEVAPIKSFKVKSNYKFGISLETKKLMRQRDNTIENIKKAQNGEKIMCISILCKKSYKNFRGNIANLKSVNHTIFSFYNMHLLTCCVSFSFIKVLLCLRIWE